MTKGKYGTDIENIAKKLSDNRDSDRSSSIDRAEDHRDVSTNEKLAVGDSDVQVGDNLIEDRGDNLGRTVVLRDVLCNNIVR